MLWFNRVRIIAIVESTETVSTLKVSDQNVIYEQPNYKTLFNSLDIGIANLTSDFLHLVPPDELKPESR